MASSSCGCSAKPFTRTDHLRGNLTAGGFGFPPFFLQVPATEPVMRSLMLWFIFLAICMWGCSIDGKLRDMNTILGTKSGIDTSR